MQIQNSDNTFVTKDLYLGALLYAKGAKLQKINRQGRVCWFIFDNRPLCESYQQEFIAKTIDVNAMDYIEALRTLKDFVFAEG